MLRSLFADPLTIKELSSVARRWQSYVSRMVYVALIAAVLLIYWVQITDQMRWMSPSDYALLGRTLFYFFAGLQMLFATLAGVSAASDLVTREVRGGTLGLLALTPLTPWGIATGKWKAAMVQAASVVLCGAPVLAICVFLGGVGSWQLLWATCLSLAAAGLGAGISLLYSSLVRTGVVAILLSLGTLFLYNLLPGVVLASGRGNDFETVFPWVCCFQVHYAFIAAMMSMEAQIFRSQELLSYAWIPAVGITLGFTLLLLGFVAARVRALLRFPAPGAGATPPGEVNAGPSRSVWQRHSLFWKELHTTGIGRLRRHVVIAVGLILAILVVAALLTQGEAVGAAFLWMGGIVLHFLAMARGSGLFVQEREERKWEVLLSTPLTAREILSSKILAGAIPLLPYGLLFFGILTAFAFSWGIEPFGWLISTGALIVDVVFAYGVGAWASLRSRNLRAAFSLTFGLVLTVVLVIPVLLLIMGSMFGFRGNTIEEDVLPLINPAPFLGPLTGLLSDRSPEDWRLQSVRQEFDKVAAPFVVYAALHLGAVAGLFASMKIGFRRITGRS